MYAHTHIYIYIYISLHVDHPKISCMTPAINVKMTSTRALSRNLKTGDRSLLFVGSWGKKINLHLVGT